MPVFLPTASARHRMMSGDGANGGSLFGAEATLAAAQGVNAVNAPSPSPSCMFYASVSAVEEPPGDQTGRGQRTKVIEAHFWAVYYRT